MPTKTKAKKTPAKKSTAKRSHKKKPELTFAQHQAVDKLKADAEQYGVEDFSVKHQEPNVVVTASGRRWSIDVLGHVSA